MASSNSQATKITHYQQLIAGLPKVAPNLVLTIANQTYTVTQLVSALETILNAASTAASTKAAWRAAARADENVESTTHGMVTQLKEMLQIMFAGNDPALGELGLSPKKPRKALTGAVLTVRTAKSNATRAARGTTSKKQKAAVHGNVTGVTITPVVAGAATAPSAAPATSTAPTSAPGGVVTVPMTPFVTATGTAGASPSNGVSPSTSGAGSGSGSAAHG